LKLDLFGQWLEKEKDRQTEGNNAERLVEIMNVLAMYEMYKKSKTNFAKVLKLPSSYY